MVEFDIHPSKRFSLLYNPNDINKSEVYEIIKQIEEYELEDVEEGESDDQKVSFSEIQPILDQEFQYPRGERKIIEVKNLFKSCHCAIINLVY